MRSGSRLACEEVFGPVLSVIRIPSLSEAIRINNEVEYGLSSSIYTRDVYAAFRAATELDNGITYVSAPTIGAEAHLPFGGSRSQATATAKAAGKSTSFIRRPRWSTSITPADSSVPRLTPTMRLCINRIEGRGLRFADRAWGVRSRARHTMIRCVCPTLDPPD